MTLLLFDVGNVIVEADEEITHKKLQGYGVSSENAKLFFKNEEYSDFARGKLDSEGFYRAIIGKYVRHGLDYQQVKDAHNSHLHGIDRAVVAILDRLSKNKLAFATNTNDWQTERERQLIDLRSYSENIFRSNEMQMLKTDDACFPYIVNQLQVKSGQITLVDDNLENILKAQNYGLQTIQFSKAEKLLDELKRRRIIP